MSQCIKEFTKSEVSKEYLRGKSLRYSVSSNPEIRAFIEQRVNLDITHKEKVYCFLHDTVPECKVCGSLTAFNNFKLGFNETCSNSCSVKLNKSKQEDTRVRNANDLTRGMTPRDLVHALVTKQLNVQKWRDLDILKPYSDFNTLTQLHAYLIKGEEQRCKYCNKVFLVNTESKESRKCTCRTKQEKYVIDIRDEPPVKFLDIFVSNNLYYYSRTKCAGITEIYYSKFRKRSDDFMEQLHLDCNDHGVEFTGYYSGTSRGEREIASFIQSIYQGEVILGDRKVLSGKELDIYIPEKKIAIEFDGLYWHSSRYKSSRYHLEKTRLCENAGLHLIHVFENEWVRKPEIVKSILRSKLGLSEKNVYARQCVLVDLSNAESKDFFEANHIQGNTVSSIRAGLVYNGKLVCAMSLGRSHRSKDRYMELKRFCSLLDTKVVGGFSKLLKYVKKKIDNQDLITFADRRYSSSDNVYSKVGNLVSCTMPNYFYVVHGDLKSREMFMKHKLPALLEKFDPALTEKENMRSSGFWEIYDCGNYKYIL